MEGIKLEAGKYYRTRDGKKAFVAGLAPFSAVNTDARATGYVEGSPYAWAWREDGFYSRSGRQTDEDLVAEWKEPKCIKGFVCIWDQPGAVAILHETKEAADAATFGSKVKLVIVPIDVLEGQGLDRSAR